MCSKFLLRYVGLLVFCLLQFSVKCQDCLVLYGNALAADENQAACIQIKAREFKDIFEYDFFLEFDHQVVRYDSMANVIFSTFGTLTIDEPSAGVLHISWLKNNMNSLSIPNNTTLFRLCFTAIGNIGEQAVIKFTNQVATPHAINILGDTLNFAGLSASINVGSTPSPLRITNGCPQSVDCANGVDGGININVAGMPDSFDWTGPGGFSAATEDIFGSLDGVYKVTATDPDNNLATGIFTTTIKNDLEISNITIVMATCNGIADGAISYDVSGGSGMYSFAWSNSETDQNLSELDPGIYELTISDDLGCSVEATFEVESGYDLGISFFNVQCATSLGMDGSVDITLSGGVPPFDFIWSNGTMTEDLSNVNPGLYVVTIVDNNQCFFVSQPIEVCSSNFGDTDACLSFVIGSTSGINGSSVCVDVLVNNFTDVTSFTSTFIWDPSAIKFTGIQNLDLFGLSGGNFNTPNAIQNNGPLLLIWDDPSVAGISVDDETVIFQMCFDVIGSNGMTSLIQFSNSPLFIEATGIVDGQLDIIPLTTVDGQVGVSDDPPPLKVFLSCLEKPRCFSDNNGSIDILVTGGVKPYSYQWSTGGTDQDLTNLSTGGYQVTVSDMGGNSTTFAVALDSNDPIISEITADTLICNGEAIQ